MSCSHSLRPRRASLATALQKELRNRAILDERHPRFVARRIHYQDIGHKTPKSQRTKMRPPLHFTLFTPLGHTYFLASEKSAALSYDALAMCSFHCAHTPGAAGLFRALRSIRPATRLFRIRSIRHFFVMHRLCARFTARIRLVRLNDNRQSLADCSSPFHAKYRII